MPSTYAQYSSSVNKFNKRIVNFNCANANTTDKTKCILNSIGITNDTTTTNDTTDYTINISLYFSDYPNYAYNVLLNGGIYPYDEPNFGTLYICIGTTTDVTESYFWEINPLLTSTPIYNQLNVNPSLAYTYNDSILTQVTPDNQPQFTTTETYNDTSYYVINAGTYYFSLYTGTETNITPLQNTTTITYIVLQVDTTSNTPTQQLLSYTIT